MRLGTLTSTKSRALADRVGIAIKNHQGEFMLINGNQLASLLVFYILKARTEMGALDQQRHYMVKTIVTTELIDNMCASYGIDCFNTLTGFKYIATVIRELEGERDGAIEDYELVEREKREAEDEFEDAKNDLEGDIEDLENKVNESEIIISTLETDKENLERDLQEMESRASEFEMKVDELETELAEVEA